MYSKTIAAALVAAPVAVSAYGNAIIHNQCSSNVYMWSVSYENTGSMQTIAPGASYSEQYYKPTNGGGVSMKMAMSPFGAFDSSAITQFEYTLDGMIWYDISNINGYPFEKEGLKLVPGDASCPTKVCPANQKLCGDAYNTPDENDATGACGADTDTNFYLCGEAPQSGSAAAAPVSNEDVVEKPAAKPVAKSAPAPAPKEQSSPAPAPAAASSSVAAPAPVAAPQVTSAPVAAPSPAAAVDAGVYTTFVTQVVTVAARDAAPEPTALPLKRDDNHANMHKRAAHRHHFHRHGDVN